MATLDTIRGDFVMTGIHLLSERLPAVNQQDLKSTQSYPRLWRDINGVLLFAS
jgi:hypothetical protein